MTRKLADDERALWAKVVATVKPLHRVALPAREPPHTRRSVPTLPRGPSGGTPLRKSEPSAPADTLDSSWDRRLERGLVRPDVTIDLHGHSLAAAHSLLERRLGEAIAADIRVVLLVTGRPPITADRPARRGAIRAAVTDWLAASPHGAEIAAIRAAHQRHGGAGALYLILRRRRRAHRQKS